MAKSDYPSTPPYQDQSTLAEAIKELAAAIAASRAGSAPSAEARAAGIQYLEIKGALRRYFEPDQTIPDNASSGTDKYQ
jgi:DnaJ-domain-containing protein 1